MKEIKKILKRVIEKHPKEEVAYYRQLSDPEKDKHHWETMKSRGARLLYELLPSEGEEIEPFALGIISLEKAVKNIPDLEWEVEKEEGSIPYYRSIAFRGRNEEGDYILFSLFPLNSPVGVMLGGVEISMDEFDEIWKDLED